MWAEVAQGLSYPVFQKTSAMSQSQVAVLQGVAVHIQGGGFIFFGKLEAVAPFVMNAGKADNPALPCARQNGSEYQTPTVLGARQFRS